MYLGPCQTNREALARRHRKVDAEACTSLALLQHRSQLHLDLVVPVHSRALCLFLLQHQCSPVNQNRENPANQQSACAELGTGAAYLKSL